MIDRTKLEEVNVITYYLKPIWYGFVTPRSGYVYRRYTERFDNGLVRHTYRFLLKEKVL